MKRWGHPPRPLQRGTSPVFSLLTATNLSRGRSVSWDYYYITFDMERLSLNLVRENLPTADAATSATTFPSERISEWIQFTKKP